MATGNRRRSMFDDTFHIQFPARKEFFSWAELGCLLRALGFPHGLVRQSLTEEIQSDEHGISTQEVVKMMEMKLLHPPLHRSFNFHSADWNLCVMRKAMLLLQIRLLTFEELFHIRVAYGTYEAADMKGLSLNQRTLLRTLKLCRRVISPKKLMHRVKHMRSRLEEPDRIQLYEFFELIMWCNYLDTDGLQLQREHSSSKQEGLYDLVDFETLLSHHDQRQSRELDQRYLAEEWDFGQERLGSKAMFTGHVVHIKDRQRQTRSQKRKYRHLKREVSQSQRSVYRASAGSIRSRPISAPDLSAYSPPAEKPRPVTASASAVYKEVLRKLTSAPPRASSLTIPSRPVTRAHVRVSTPSVVTSGDIDDVKMKMENLEFDIITLDSRCQVKLEEERNFYIPNYKPPPEENTEEKKEDPPVKREHWTFDIIQNLTYPPLHLPHHHAHSCDARFRGWAPSSERGLQKILTEPTYDSSPHGQMRTKQRSALMIPVSRVHKNHVTRYTSQEEAIR